MFDYDTEQFDEEFDRIVKSISSGKEVKEKNILEEQLESNVTVVYDATKMTGTILKNKMKAFLELTRKQPKIRITGNWGDYTTGNELWLAGHGYAKVVQIGSKFIQVEYDNKISRFSLPQEFKGTEIILTDREDQ